MSIAKCKCPECGAKYVGPVPDGAKLFIPLPSNWRTHPVYVVTCADCTKEWRQFCDEARQRIERDQRSQVCPGA